MKRIIWIAVMAFCIAILIGGVAAAEPQYLGAPPSEKIKDETSDVVKGVQDPGGTVTTPYYVRYYEHGGGATIQNPEATTSSRYYGWGLTYYLKAFTGGTWFHITPTSPSILDRTIKARYVIVQFYLGAGVTSDRIDVWNGYTKVKQFDYLGSAAMSGPVWKTVTMDLGNYVEFNRGLGISVRTRPPAIPIACQAPCPNFLRVDVASGGGHFMYS